MALRKSVTPLPPTLAFHSNCEHLLSPSSIRLQRELTKKNQADPKKEYSLWRSTMQAQPKIQAQNTKARNIDTHVHTKGKEANIIGSLTNFISDKNSEITLKLAHIDKLRHESTINSHQGTTSTAVALNFNAEEMFKEVQRNL